MAELKRTPLYESHKKHGGKLVDFAGWELPIQYEGISGEHEAVRNHVGIFDVSHMGEVEIKGQDATAFVQNLVTNDIGVLADFQILYTLMCYPHGGIVDDLLVYKYHKNHYLLVINAGNIQKDLDWIFKNREGYNVDISDISSITAEMALQGPKAEELLQRLADVDLSQIGFFYFNEKVNIEGAECLVSRTGYTGEDGFEIYLKNEDAEKVWDAIMKAGGDLGIKAAGLGARDTLRFEANLPLYGNEMTEDITPLEAGLGYFVKLNKDHFIGKDALVKQKAEGLTRKIVGFEMEDKGIPRHGYDVLDGDKKIGFVTTGYLSPTLKKAIGLAMVEIKYAELGTTIEILLRNKPSKGKVVSRKFYTKQYKK
ncbi:glycine cleavage system aminomethyltransferase GcvT [Alkaliphilus serpentinus]|uniref:Aminomethyltransferase n=1 Tax=Alkaliphilus serpentinus TaxID=1482731 RepID=A0A833M7Q9_9FIRM|nr:glycine cleavage system aminomethyltransferase GcvT [Alkaliphilus serpentinus]KAB3531133.1 glycine cleavage system aminomethyltransferase GcvT [Alkaliphilus serpentinus]